MTTNPFQVCAVVVWITNRCDNLTELWDLSGFKSRVDQLGLRVVVLDQARVSSPVANWTYVESFQDLLVDTSFEVVKRFLVLEDCQLFFDRNVVSSAITVAGEKNRDLYTQWEHCRLPVGVGARVLSRFAIEKTRADTPDEVLSILNNDPANYSVAYDPDIYVGSDLALLDTRWAKKLDPLIRHGGIDWSLAGVEMISAASREVFPRYRTNPNGQIIDERGMPSQYGFEKDECANFPTYIMFDLTNKCNAACVMCPQAIGFPGQSNTTMLSTEVFFSVIDQCVGKNLDVVRITADGEPTIHPKFWQLLDYAKSKDVGPIGLTTNGSTLTDKNIDRLFASNVAFIDVSLDAFRKETFEKIRVGLSFEKTIRNVHRLIEKNLIEGSPIKIMVSFVEQEANINEVNKFSDYWTPIVDKVLIRELTTNVGINKNSNSEEKKQLKRWPCPHFWRRVVVNYDGNLKACPIDWNNRLVNEPLEISPIEKQWHSEFYHDYRMQHLNDNHRVDSICNKCTDWSTTSWTIGYEKVVGDLL